MSRKGSSSGLSMVRIFITKDQSDSEAGVMNIHFFSKGKVELAENVSKAKAQFSPRETMTFVSDDIMIFQATWYTHLMPRQPRGPLEKATSQLSSSFDSSQRSGRKS